MIEVSGFVKNSFLKTAILLISFLWCWAIPWVVQAGLRVGNQKVAHMPPRPNRLKIAFKATAATGPARSPLYHIFFSIYNLLSQLQKWMLY